MPSHDFDRILRPALGAALVLACAPGAMAQCAFQTTLLQGYELNTAAQEGDAQNPRSLWTYRRSDQDGALLTGVLAAGNLVWGAADQAFVVPTVGPRCSPVPARNQATFVHRQPSFEGVFFHPGAGSINVLAECRPGAPITLTGLILTAEDLGVLSPNLVVSVQVRTATSVVEIIPPTSILSLAPAVTLMPTADRFPIELSPTTSLVIVGDNGGSPSEDWGNVQATLFFDGPPVVLAQPVSHESCPRSVTSFHVVGLAQTSFLWRRNNEPLTDGPLESGAVVSGSQTDTLVLSNVHDVDFGVFDCILSNACASVISAPAALAVCPSDFNCDGRIDPDDLADCIACYFGQPCPRGDTNGDGVVDPDDLADFISSYFAGC